MPRKPLRPCRHPDCPVLSNNVYCDAHRSLYARESATVRGYDARWRKARKQFLRQNPLCVECERNKKLTPAIIVDHVLPHRGDDYLFWDKNNWQALCKRCHDKKTGLGY